MILFHFQVVNLIHFHPFWFVKSQDKTTFPSLTYDVYFLSELSHFEMIIIQMFNSLYKKRNSIERSPPKIATRYSHFTSKGHTISYARPEVQKFWRETQSHFSSYQKSFTVINTSPLRFLNLEGIQGPPSRHAASVDWISWTRAQIRSPIFRFKCASFELWTLQVTKPVSARPPHRSKHCGRAAWWPLLAMINALSIKWHVIRLVTGRQCRHLPICRVAAPHS